MTHYTADATAAAHTEIRDEYLNTRQLAELTHTQPQTWRRRRWAGGGPPYVKLGNRVIYRRREVDRWLSERTYDNTTEATAAGR